jgi:photosystem II stability/assembly factor-like uncharacterized protein/tetratricopeptide (TPR) repeat protein
MDEIINPYIAGAPVTEKRMFFGREDVFTWIERSLSGQYADHILVVHGQRRVGKTSVLKQLSNRLPKRYIPIFFDLQGRTHTTLDRFLWWLAREIARVLKQDRDISITPPDKELFTQDIEYFETRFLPDLKLVLGDDSILLLTFDEFDNLEESEVKETLAQPLIDHLRRMMGNPNVNFIFSIGSSGRKLENMQANYTEFFKTALYRKISFLTKDDAHRLITMPVQGTIEYDKDAVQYIFEIVSGHPYFTQLICHELFSQCQKTGERTVNLVDVKSVLDDVVERGTVNLKFVWDEAADLEKWSLSCLAQLEGKRDTRAVTDYLTRQRVRFNQQALDSALLHLREKDVLTDDHRFVNQLLQIWLKKNRPIEQVREELTEVNPIANRYIEIGLEFKNSRQYQKAIESFQEALDIDADNLQAQVNLALTYLDQKNVEKAILGFEKALIIDEEDIVSRAGLCDAYLAQGDLARERGRPRDAILAYQKVLDINAEHTEARGRMAEINRQRAEKALEDGKDEEALNAFAEALKFTPEDPALIARVEKVRAEKKAKVLAAQVARSEKEANAGNWEKAIAALKEALAVSPADESILKKIESVKERQKKERLDAILAKADQAEKSSHWDAAIAALNEYLLLQSDDAAIQKRLTDLIAAKRTAWLKAISTRADQAVSYQNWDDALAIVNEVLAIEPGNTEIKSKAEKIFAAKRVAELNAMLKRVEQAAQAGRWDEAIDILNGGLASQPENETLQTKLAEVRKAKREARLKAALRLADTAAQAGKWSTAIEALNEVLANEPENMEFQKKLAEIKKLERESKLANLQAQARSFAKAEKFEESLAAWNEYLALEPDKREKALVEIESVKKTQGLSHAYEEAYNTYSRKNYEKAISLFKEIVVEDTDYKDATSLLAEAIRLRRTQRKWWQSKWLWGGISGVVVLAVAWFVLRPGSPLMAALLASNPAPITTNTPSTSAIVSTEIPVLLPTVTPAPLPLAWTRLNSGQFLPRATISSIVFNPADPGVMYTGTAGAGIFKSIDGGISWQPVQNGLKRSDISSLIIDPADPDTLYAGVVLDGIYKTSDGAESWQPINEGIEVPGGPLLATVAMDPTNYKHLYYTDSMELYETTNGGESWTKLKMPACPKIITSLVIPTGTSNTIYIADREKSDDCELGIYRSRDGGSTWDLIPIGISETLQLRYWSLAVAPEPKERIYISGGIAEDDKFYRTMDEGKTWKAILNHRCFATYMDPNQNEKIFCGGPDRLLASRDAGDSWNPILSGESIWEIAVSPHSKDTLTAGGDGSGLFISNDGGVKWSDSNSGLGGTYLSLSISPLDNATLFAEGGYGVHRSTDKGQTWDLLTNQGSGLAFDANKTTMYILADTIMKSEDDGKTWKATTKTSQRISSFVTHPLLPNMLIAIHDSGFSFSFDSGQNWNESNDVAWSRESDEIFGTVFTSLFPDPSGLRYYILINGETEGKVLRVDSTTGDWQACQLPINLTTINLLAIDPRDSDRIVISSPGNGVLISSDGCQSWSSSNDGLGSLFVNTIVMEPITPDTIYAGTDGGAYVSSNGGQTWGQVNDGLLGAMVVYSIAVDKDSNVYAATPYGIFKLEGK